MIKILFILLLLYHDSFARVIKPAFIMTTSGLVLDFVIDGDKLYVGTDAGSVDIFSLREQKLVDQIFLKPILSGQGKQIAAKVISVDRYHDKTLIVTTTRGNARAVWLHDGEHLNAIIKAEDKKMVRKARFINEKEFIFASVGYELSRYTLDDSYALYNNHIEMSAFSDMELSEDKSIMISASESGIVTISDVKSGKIVKKLSELNVDNIYKLAYKNGTTITAGQDRRVGVYPKNGKPYYIKSDFLVYAVGLSPSGDIGVYSANEESDLQLFDVASGKKGDKLIGHHAIPSTIRFFSNKGFFSAGYENKIYYWHLENQ